MAIRDDDIIVEFRDTWKAFEDNQVHAGINLKVRRGETLSLIAGSGEGKSVLLKQVVGLFKPERGHIFIEGVDIVPLPERKLFEIRKKIGYLFQGAALFDSLTVFENIAYPLRERYRHMKEPEIRKIVMERIELVGLEPQMAKLMPVELSGGMKKRVGLARAFATDPEIILWDEPTTELDPTNVRRIVDLIKELQKTRNITSIAVTHDMESIFAFSDRIAMIYEKKVKAVGTVDEMRDSRDEVVHDFIHGYMHHYIRK